MTSTDLTLLYRSGYLTEIDVHFADFMTRLDGRENGAVALAAALISRSAGNGHVCLDLNTVARSLTVTPGETHAAVICPETAEWIKHLRTSPVIGCPGEQRPLILDDCERLYLYRYWRYEQDLVAAINLRTGDKNDYENVRPEALQNAFERLFPSGRGGGEVDWQKVAALVALMKSFCVISGGPGTGKTHTVAKILALLTEQAGDTRFRAALAAPTGKAAAKLSESMKTAVKTLACSPALKERIPVEAQTIHRMLDPIPGTPYFRFDKNNPLPVDAVIVDEASMIDLALLSKLATALPDRARLVLIGDKDQLASVEAGAVLGDICDRGRRHRFSVKFCETARQVIGTALDACGSEKTRGIQDCIVNLVKSYRFDDHGGIGALSRAINRGDVDRAMNVLKTAADGRIGWRPVSSARELYRSLEEPVVRGYRDYLSTDDPLLAMERFSRFRILCAVNRGSRGVEALNHATEKMLRRKGLIKPEKDRYQDRWYAGRPILVTANDYVLGLFNGDIGLAASTSADDKASLIVHFPGHDGRTRGIATARISGVETVYAMSIHKSQGSEFDQVHVVLPDADSAVLTRELIYTAVTRARSSVTLWGQKQVLEKALSRQITRRSGLREALWGRDAEWNGKKGSVA
jgi:exodeoxyribonuclease V alpha subunit